MNKTIETKFCESFFSYAPRIDSYINLQQTKKGDWLNIAGRIELRSIEKKLYLPPSEANLPAIDIKRIYTIYLKGDYIHVHEYDKDFSNLNNQLQPVRKGGYLCSEFGRAQQLIGGLDLMAEYKDNLKKAFLQNQKKDIDEMIKSLRGKE